MKSRHRAREIALQILYQYDLRHRTVEAATPQKTSPVITPVTPIATRSPTSTFLSASLPSVGDLKSHYDHFHVPEDLREWVGQLVAGTLTSVNTLDPILEKHTTHWRVSRLSSVDRCLLRMALYEMQNFPSTPRAIVIDEAIELAKEFGSEETPAFVNGVLDQIKMTELV